MKKVLVVLVLATSMNAFAGGIKLRSPHIRFSKIKIHSPHFRKVKVGKVKVGKVKFHR